VIRRAAALAFAFGAVTVVAGCRPFGGASAPTATPTPRVETTPRGYRVAVVDVDRVMRSHRRWPELAAVIKKMDALQVRLTSPPPPPDLPLTPPEGGVINLDAEAKRLQVSMTAELEELRMQLRTRLEAYVNDLRAEHEAKLADRQREANAEFQKTMEAKRDELQRDLEKYELSVMAEYRIPLANLRVKSDVVGVANEEEAKRMTAEAERIHKERDDKVRARATELEKQFQEFQQGKTAEFEARFKALVASAEEEVNAKTKAKDEELRAEFQTALHGREEAFKAAMEERRRLAIQAAQSTQQTGEAQIRAAQARYAKQLEAEGARIRAELQALTAQRLRLEDSVFAEIKIEVATVAQERRVDAVVARAVTYPGAIDLTGDLIARLKRL
jgi:hypothetical protein